MKNVRKIATAFAVFSAALTLVSVSIVGAQAQFITPASNLVIEGIPPIPLALTTKVAAYTEFKASAVVAWHPRDGSVLIRSRLGNVAQLQLLKSAGAKPEPLTDFPDAVTGGTFQPKKGAYLLFEKASGGDEVFRIYRLDLNEASTHANKKITAISPEGERAAAPSCAGTSRRHRYERGCSIGGAQP